MSIFVGNRKLCAAAVAVAGFMWASEVRAQEGSERDFSAERFQLASDGDGILGTEDATVIGHKNWEIGLWMGLADDPLTIYRDMDGEITRAEPLLSRRIGGELVGAFGIKNRFQIGLQVPIIANQAFGADASDVAMFGPESTLGLGDVRVLPKIQLLFADRHKVDLAFLATFTIPTGASDSYAGERNFTFTPELAVSRLFGSVKVAGNVGYRVRQNNAFNNLDVWDEVYFKVAAGYIIGMGGERPLELDLSAVLATSAADFLGSFNSNSSELLAGAKYQVAPTWQAFVGGGFGTSAGFGTPDWRVLAGARYVRRVYDRDQDGLVDARDQCPDDPEDKDGFQDENGCPDPDNDKDGILDVADGAPDDPEDKDDFEDGDGVPDPDNDKDGFVDAEDACPLKAETVNSYKDQDGCPDEVPDTDGDGLNDQLDVCPEQPEDKDGYEDGNGCPDPDNDKDKVLDTQDNCINEPGPVENKGCPDTDRDGDTVVDRLDNCPDEPGAVDNQGCKAKQLVQLSGTTLKILDKVYFATNRAKIRRKSYKLLRNVAKVLKSHPEIKKIRVEGHTDDRGDDNFNMDLSQRRADAVVAFLVKAGVAADRLAAKGFGETKPIDDNKSRKGRANNRRVEFNIVDDIDAVIDSSSQDK